MDISYEDANVERPKVDQREVEENACHYDEEVYIEVNEDDKVLEEDKDHMSEDAREEESRLNDLKQNTNVDSVKLEESNVSYIVGNESSMVSQVVVSGDKEIACL